MSRPIKFLATDDNLFVKSELTMNAAANNTADRQDLKRQIRQLESIAALSGGIAHDYNNLLTAIMGNISLALEHVAPDAKLSSLLEQALEASRVAQTLTRRLITFSKGGQPDKKPTDIVPVVEDTAAFSLSGSNIRCEFGPSDGTWSADVDPQQIGQAIHNLMVNAAESMPAGGTVSISFENTTLASTNGILPPGRYIDVSITDQGVGIPAEHIEKIFDPYFSTKAKGCRPKNRSGAFHFPFDHFQSWRGDHCLLRRSASAAPFTSCFPPRKAALEVVHPVMPGNTAANRQTSCRPGSNSGDGR